MSARDAGLVERGREVLAIEREALDRVASRLDASFARAVRALERTPGKVIVTGVGKSGIIAQKIAATLTSTGTPAFALHAVDALHGDLGMAQPGDVVLLLSKSGQSAELEQLLPPLKAIGVTTIAITGNVKSALARSSQVVLDASVEREACPFDLAPTASTTAMLALGDALAVALLERKGISRDVFARTHPGGAIGRQLAMRVEEVMKRGDALPVVAPNARIDTIVPEMGRGRMGAALVVKRGRLVGIITDGDLRRLLAARADLYALDAEGMMTRSPMTAPPDFPASAALALLEEHKRTQLPIVDIRGKLLGAVHLHDLVERGIGEL